MHRTSPAPNRDLVGKSIDQVLKYMLGMDYWLKFEDQWIQVQVSQLSFVDYQQEKPRKVEDCFGYVDINHPEANMALNRYLQAAPGSAVGLLSQVEIDHEQTRHPLINLPKHHYAHIPMLDLDIHGGLSQLDEQELTYHLADRIRKDTEMRHGLILRSGSPHHYHYLGLPQLLDQADFVTFIGLSLTMRHQDPEGFYPLADTRHLGHGLAPMKYLSDLADDPSWSRYEFGQRFLTLRITPRHKREQKPVVVACF